MERWSALAFRPSEFSCRASISVSCKWWASSNQPFRCGCTSRRPTRSRSPHGIQPVRESGRSSSFFDHDCPPRSPPGSRASASHSFRGHVSGELSCFCEQHGFCRTVRTLVAPRSASKERQYGGVWLRVGPQHWAGIHVFGVVSYHVANRTLSFHVIATDTMLDIFISPSASFSSVACGSCAIVSPRSTLRGSSPGPSSDNAVLRGLVHQLIDLCQGNQREIRSLRDEVAQLRTHICTLQRSSLLLSFRLLQPLLPCPAPGLGLLCLILPGLSLPDSIPRQTLKSI